MLTTKEISVAYGRSVALDNVSLSVRPGEMLAVVGANGAGKSTLASALVGTAALRSGAVFLDGKDISRASTTSRVSRGVTLVPEGRHLFPMMSVEENLRVGATHGHSSRAVDERINDVLKLFPRLGERLNQTAATMSGGEQQMVAIGRGLMADPSVLILDEPTLGLSPLMVTKTFEALATLRSQGLSILLLEQNLRQSLAVADRGLVLERGRPRLEGSGQDLLNDESLVAAYFGASSQSHKSNRE